MELQTKCYDIFKQLHSSITDYLMVRKNIQYKRTNFKYLVINNTITSFRHVPGNIARGGTTEANILSADQKTVLQMHDIAFRCNF